MKNCRVHPSHWLISTQVAVILLVAATQNMLACGVFTALCDQYKAKGYDLYGVSCDAVAANKAFHEKFDFAFPLLSVWNQPVCRVHPTILH